MTLETQFEVALQLLLVSFLSALIGAERERGDHPAGLRTHMLVGIGACLFTALSRFAFGDGDPGRTASQIVVGVGFLGAGVIIQRDDGIRHLTTAASIWATAAMGMAVGAGAWFLAIITTLLMWFILAIMLRFEKAVISTRKDQ